MRTQSGEQAPKQIGRQPLDRRSIALAALSLLDELGLDGLSTRKLALRLNVEGPALYHHFRNKQDLLGEMANAVLFGAIEGITAQNWQAWIIQTSTAIRAALAQYRDGARLVTSAWPNAEMDQMLLPHMLAPLREAGFSLPLAQRAILMLSSLVVGWTLNETNPAVRVRLEQQFDIDAAFQLSLATFVRGLEIDLARELGAAAG